LKHCLGLIKVFDLQGEISYNINGFREKANDFAKQAEFVPQAISHVIL